MNECSLPGFFQGRNYSLNSGVPIQEEKNVEIGTGHGYSLLIQLRDMGERHELQPPLAESGAEPRPKTVLM